MFAGPDLLVIFGGNRISELGAGLGKGIRDFKKGLQEDDTEATPKKLEDNSRKSKE